MRPKAGRYERTHKGSKKKKKKGKELFLKLYARYFTDFKKSCAFKTILKTYESTKGN